MIRFVEITPPKEVIFRQAKIMSFAVSEGSQVKAGDALFIIESAGKEYPLPAPNDGRIVEFIVDPGDSIHANSSLLLLEMEVEETTRPKPVSAKSLTRNSANNSTKKKKKTTKKTKHKKKTTKSSSETEKQQQLFDVLDNNGSDNIDTNNQNENTFEKRNDMSEITIPDLGGADAVEVIDILVKEGDTVTIDDALMTVESDKASMDIPASTSGVIETILVKVGDSVSEGDAVFKLAGEAPTTETVKEAPTDENKESSPPPAAKSDSKITTASKDIKVTIPDLGGANDVEVIELLVSVGDTVKADQPVITVESDKASMDVPTSTSGTIKAISIAVGDTVNEGDSIIIVAATGETAEAVTTSPAASSPSKKASATAKVAESSEAEQASKGSEAQQQAAPNTGGEYHASPSVRRFARELGVDLSKVTGTNRKNRISKDDVKVFVKGVINNKAPMVASAGAGIPEVPAQDFSKFGDIEIQALNKIKRVTASHLHRSWLNVPHVTHSDESNIASLEEFRKTLNAEYAKRKQDIKLSPLAFIVKAAVNALKNYPQFNSSLENGGENLIVKNYYHIGIAVETPNGLVVPVIRDADTLSLAEIAQAMGDLAKKARDGKLTANDMSGGTFTISSLGGIGGTHFTPIVNAPEVAILGVSRTKMQPVWNGSEFVPAPILPLSLSYDHRVIDGAEAARFTRHIAAVLEDLRRLAL